MNYCLFLFLRSALSLEGEERKEVEQFQKHVLTEEYLLLINKKETYKFTFTTTNVVNKEVNVNGRSKVVSYKDHKLGKFAIIKETNDTTTITENAVVKGTITEAKSSVSGSFKLDGNKFMVTNRDYYMKTKAENEPTLDKDTEIVVYKSVPTDEVFYCGTKHTYKEEKKASGFSQKFTEQLLDMIPSIPHAHAKSLSNSGCPRNLSFLYIGVAMDASYSQRYVTQDDAMIDIIKNTNKINKIYVRDFNIAIGIAAFVIMEEKGTFSWNDMCTKRMNIERRLKEFSVSVNDHQDLFIRKVNEESLGLWHLVMGCRQCVTLGIAATDGACKLTENKKRKFDGVSLSFGSTNHAFIMAHEIAHNLGASHDCTTSDCAMERRKRKCCECENCDCKNKYIMMPYVKGTEKLNNFSDCSISEICSKFLINGTCISEPSSLTPISLGVCGNGIKEQGEECDCGDNCENDPCCTSECKLKPHAECSDVNDNCCKNCKIISKNTNFVCRNSDDPCTEKSVCNGKDPFCPQSKKAENGTECNTNRKCANGICTSRDHQCYQMGNSLGITGACEEKMNSCIVWCKMDNTCAEFSNLFFMDGTECLFGTCKGGDCLFSNTGISSTAIVFIVLGSLIGGCIVIWILYRLIYFILA